MRRKLAIFLILFGTAVSLPATALAQSQNPSWGSWYGPWFMGGGSSWWWICPLVMLAMMAVMMVFGRGMGCGGHRD